MRIILLVIFVFFSSAAFAQDKLTYDEHARPIFAANCLSCHNPDKLKGGLDLSTYASMMRGSSNGKVLEPGDPDGSLLYLLVTHQEEPHMPPKRNKLEEKNLDLLK